MSNPLSSLNRYPRRPFKEKDFSKINEKFLNITRNYNETVPNEFDSSLLDNGLNELLDDVSTDIAMQNILKSSNGLMKPISGSSSGCISSRSNEYSNCKPLIEDFELVSKLMKRIKQLESVQRFQEKEIKDKNLRIKVLEEKCKLYTQTKEIYECKSDKIKDLEKECERLTIQVAEMEKFLADYGLMWVGDSVSDDRQDSVEITSVVNSGTDKDGTFLVDYDKILKNIEDLNHLMKSEESQVTLVGPQRVELKKKQTIRLILYANGISLFDGPFRSFSHKSTRDVIQDIIDGYFPSELEERYPSGVPIQTVDRRNIFFDAKEINVFQGMGKTLGGVSSSSKLLNNSDQNRNDRNYVQPFTDVLTTDPELQITMEQFLNKLPNSVINKDGRIISIRNSIRDIIENKPLRPLDIFSSRTLTNNDDDHGVVPNQSRKLAKIKVRSLNGEKLYRIDMKSDMLVKDLYHQVAEIAEISVDKFVLVPAVSSTNKLADMNLTIEACGLVPNASLCMKLI